MYAIETKKLTKKFKDKTAVNGMDLNIKQGELLHFWELMVQEKPQQ